MDKVMITIGRQFGSGGHKIGEYLSNRLGISYYDNELILLAAQRGDLKVEPIREMDEMIQNPFHSFPASAGSDPADRGEGECCFRRPLCGRGSAQGGV